MKRKLLSAILIMALLLTLLAALTATAYAGQHFRTCPFCGSTNFDEGGGSYVAPTCTAKGSVKIYCSCYNYQARTYTIKALGHDWGKWKTVKEATCEKQGERKHTCARCGVTEKEKTKKKAHSYGEWTIVREATDHSTGLRRRTCKKCGNVQEEEFYPDGTLRKDGDNEKKAVKDLQNALNKAGYDCGKADGVFGKNTKKAVEEFQRDHGLDPDGIAWPQTQDLLFGRAKKPEAETARLLLVVEQTTPDQATYQPGDTVDYTLTLTNTGNVVLTHPRVERYVGDGATGVTDLAYDTDPTNPDGGTIGPGESHTTGTSYTFTREDAQLDAGKIGITFRGLGERPDGRTIQSADRPFDYTLVIRGIVDDNPIRPTSEASFTTCEYSSSTDPAGYALGEKVTFEGVFANDGNTDIGGADAYAALNEDPAGLMESFSKVEAETAEICFYDYTVQPADQIRGTVTFSASVTWIDPLTGDPRSLTAEPITVKVLPESVDTIIPKIDLPREQKLLNGKLRTQAPKGDCCARSLKFVSEYDEEYLLHFCADHVKTEQSVTKAVNAAKTAGEKEEAWQQAAQRWQEELDALYEACRAAADAEAQEIITDDQTTFAAYLTEWEKELTLLHPAAPELVREKVATALRDRVADLCYLLHTAPADRADSYLTGDYEAIDGFSLAYGCCTEDIVKTEGSNVSYLVIPCSTHCETDLEARNLILSEQGTEMAFTQASKLWIDLANESYRTVYRSLSGTDRSIITGECKRYSDWLAADRAFLALFYPDKPETVAEMICAALRTKCLHLCNEMTIAR